MNTEVLKRRLFEVRFKTVGIYELRDGSTALFDPHGKHRSTPSHNKVGEYCVTEERVRLFGRWKTIESIPNANFRNG